jgi:hypothetical protein
MVASTDAPVGGGASSRRVGAPLPIAAAVAALWAVISGLAPVLLVAVVAALGTKAAVGDAIRIGVGAWLLGHGVPVLTPTDHITLMPLAITAWVARRLWRAGVHASRAGGAHRSAAAWPPVRAGLTVAAGYALLGLGVARLAGTSDVTVSASRAVLTLGLFAAVAAVGGAVQYGRAGRFLAARVPVVLTQAVRTATAALALAGSEATHMLAAFQAGVAGQIGITALCLVFLPNLAVWGAAYLVGPGFVLGTGTVVSPEDVLLGPIPALPVFAALPDGPLGGIGPALLGVPLLAGVAAGLLLGRRSEAPRPDASPHSGAGRRGGGWGPLLAAAGLAGPVAGLLVQLAVLAARGSLGSGRLAHLGVYDTRVAVLAGAVIGVGTVAGAIMRRWLAHTRS